VVPPDAVNVALLPLQIVKEGLAEIVGEGIGFTVKVAVVVPTHPLAVPLTVYVVVVVGVATGFDMLALLKLPAGAQV
jgi:hypothetical protein